jgi:hypothetical protein
MVDTELIEEASESAPPLAPVNKLVAVELCLFFFGIEGRTLPGNSVLNAL